MLPEHGHVGHAVAKLETAHAFADLIDFTDDIVAKDEGGRRDIVWG